MITASIRFSYAPKLARNVDTFSIAVSIELIEAVAWASVNTAKPLTVVEASSLWAISPSLSSPVCASVSPSSITIVLPSFDVRVNVP